ncbi:hypothetical protein N9V65_01765 [Flavobacteriales bacterium]|nr:hypothetical protein [Flavobacteriales bacterium]
MKNQHLIDNLSTSEKADLFQHLYAELAGQGTDGDTELAHVNRFEAQVLRNIGGSGTVNKVTGLRQYGKGGSAPPPPPSSTTTRQVPEYAPEQREYIADIFGKSQELYEQRTEEGFQPFPGAQLAPFAAQEQEAFGGIESLARGPGAAPAFDIARNAALGAAAPITAGEVQQGMNPYQQGVTDIGKREAVRQYQRGPQAQLRSGAVEAGGLRGARRFIEEGEGQRNLNQQLADLQTMGSQQAFQQSMAEAAAARGRLANLATQMPSIGMGAYNQQMQQLGQLGGVGEAYRAREQAAIDLAQNQFQQEQMFPEETLATYLRFITNAPSPSGFQRTTQTPGIAGPGTLQQLAGLGIGGAATGKAFGLFSSGGAVPPASGRRAGLSGIVRRANGGQIVRLQTGSIKNTGGYGGYFGDFEKYYSGSDGVQDIINAYTPPTTPVGGDSGYDIVPVDEVIAEALQPTGLLVSEVEPKLKPTPTAQVKKDIEKLNTRTLSEPEPKPEPKSETGTISDAGYLDIAAAALAGMSATDPAGTPQTTLGQLSKVLSPTAKAAASGMRDADKTAREQKLLDMAITKETREATSAGVVDALRRQQTETERLQPDSNRIKEMAAIQKVLSNPGELDQDQIDRLAKRFAVLAGLVQTTAGGGSQSDDNLPTGNPRKLRS